MKLRSLICQMTAMFISGSALADYVAYPDQSDSLTDASYADSGYDASLSASDYHGPYLSSSQNPKSYIPSQIQMEYLGHMGYKGGRGSAKLTSMGVQFNLFGHKGNKFAMHSDVGFRMAWFDSTGDGWMDENRFYTVVLRMNGEYSLTQKTSLVMGFNPQISTDGDTWTGKAIYFGGFLGFKSEWSSNLKYGFGLSYSPQFGSSPWLPFISLSWQMNNKWRLEMEGTRLAMLQKVSDGFTWGPFVGIVTGAWSVKHDRSTRQFQWTSGVAGISSSIGLGKWGTWRPRLTSDLGFSFSNVGKINTSTGRHEIYKRNYDSGFYMRLGLQFGF